MPFPLLSPRRPKGETFDQVPQWFMRRLINAGEFENFEELAFKLLFYFAKVRNSKDITPWTTNEELSERVGAGPKRTKRARLALLEIGVVRQETKRKEIRFRLVFKDPYVHTQETTAGQTPLRPLKASSKSWGQTTTATATERDVHLDASVEGGFPSGVYAETADNLDRFGPQLTPKGQASLDCDSAWPQSWDDVGASPDSLAPRAYTAGEDVDSIAQGNPQ